MNTQAHPNWQEPHFTALLAKAEAMKLYDTLIELHLLPNTHPNKHGLIANTLTDINLTAQFSSRKGIR